MTLVSYMKYNYGILLYKKKERFSEFLNTLYFQYFSMVLSIESVLEEILMKQFHTLSPMYGKFFCKVVSLSMGKIK